MSRLEKLKSMGSGDEKLNYLKTLHLPTVIKKVDDIYYCTSPGFGLVASGRDANAAFNAMESLKEKYFIEMIKIDSEDEIPLPESPFSRENMALKIKIGLLKYFFIFIFCLLTAFVTGKIVSNVLLDTSEKFAVKIENSLYPPENIKAEKIEKFREAMKNIKPYVAEMKKTLE